MRHASKPDTPFVYLCALRFVFVSIILFVFVLVSYIMYSRDVNASGRGSDTPHQSAEHNGLQFRPQCIDCIWPPTDLTGSALHSRVVLITQSLNQLLCVISTTLLHSCTVNTAHTMCKPPCTEYTTICYYDA